MMLKKIIILILCVGINLQAFGSTQTQEPRADQTKQACINLVLKAVLVAELLTFTYLVSPEPVQKNIERQLSRSALAWNFITEYLSWSLCTLAHESGHALTRKLLTGEPSTIHLGSATATAEPLVTIGPLCIDSLNPTSGHTNPNGCALLRTFFDAYKHKNSIAANTPLTPEQVANLLQSQEFAAAQKSFRSSPHNLIISAAGSLSGLLVYHLVQKLRTGQLKLNHITVNQLFNLILPTNPNSDAAILWREGAGIPDTIVTTVSNYAYLIDILAEILLAIKETSNPHVTPRYSQVMIGLANYLARGYLRFQA